MPVRQHEFGALVSLDQHRWHQPRLDCRAPQRRLPSETSASTAGAARPKSSAAATSKKLSTTSAYSSRRFANVYAAGDRGRIQRRKGRRIDVTRRFAAMRDANRASLKASLVVGRHAACSASPWRGTQLDWRG